MNRSAMAQPDNGKLVNTGGRQGAAAGYARQWPYGGRAAAGTGKHWLASMTISAAHNKRGQRRERM